MTRTSPTSPQDLVEHALATSTADDCIAIVHDAHQRQPALGQQHPDHQRRHARRRASPSSPSRAPPTAASATGSVSGSASATAQVTALVEAADAAARAGSPAEDVADLRDRRPPPPTGTTPPATTDIHVYDAFAPALGEAFGRAEAGGRVLYGFVNHGVTTTYLGSSTGLRLRHVQPTGHYGCTGKTADLHAAAPGSAAPPATSPTSTPLALDATLAQRLGWGDAPGRPARPGRYDTILPPRVGRRPDDRRLLVRRRPRPPTRASRSTASAAAAPGSASRSPARGRAPVLRPGLRRPRVRAVRDGGDLRQRAVGLRQRPRRWRAPTGSRDGALDVADPDPALRGDDRAARHAVRRQPGARRRRRLRRRSTTSSPAPSAACC